MRPNSIMRIALEEMRADDQCVVLKGPLSQAFTDALNVAYAKDKPSDLVKEDSQDQIATESQAIDQAIAEKMIKNLYSDEPPPTDNFQTVYGVSKNDVTTQTIVDVSQDLARKAEQDYVVIIDATKPALGEGDGEPNQKGVLLNTALESIVVANGGRVFHSLKEFTDNRKR